MDVLPYNNGNNQKKLKIFNSTIISCHLENKCDRSLVTLILTFLIGYSASGKYTVNTDSDDNDDKNVSVFLSHPYFYLSDLQESVGDVIHQATNYPELLLEKLRYCCPVEIFGFNFFSFIEILYD